MTLEGITRTELAEWERATDDLNIGVAEDIHRLAMNGWNVVHGQTGVIGLLFQGAGTLVHIEWYDPANRESFSVGWARGFVLENRQQMLTRPGGSEWRCRSNSISAASFAERGARPLVAIMPLSPPREPAICRR
ncbi:hypothetical protein ACIRH0_03875 [Streptomyces sp. NPDC093675]|uniref:hypothetical protein n=1 Tax=Streptomyces sp. NPDC093675 TaxID=3366049 RepID=UPI0037F567E7